MTVVGGERGGVERLESEKVGWAIERDFTLIERYRELHA